LPEPETDLAEGLHRTVTDELYDELVEQVTDQRVVGLAVWEESLADDPEAGPTPADQRDIFDLDLYVENHNYMELYGVQIYRDPESDPLQGLEQTGKMLSKLVEDGVWLEEVAVNEIDELVLILAQRHEPCLYLSVSGWTLEQWDNLPEED
jgi:hypothetical protein